MEAEPFLQSFDSSDLQIAKEFLTNWLPFLTKDLCESCASSLLDRIRSLSPDEKNRDDPNAEEVEGGVEESGLGADEEGSGVAEGVDDCFEASTGGWKNIKATGWDSDPATVSPKLRMSWADELEEEEARRNSLEDGKGKVRLTKTEISRDQRERIRFTSVGRKKDFVCLERIDGKIVNILEGIELHTGVFSAVEQKKIVDFVYELQAKGRNKDLGEHAYSKRSESINYMPTEGCSAIQFGCYYNHMEQNKNPPGILPNAAADPIPNLFKLMIKRLIGWHVIPASCVPDTCSVNIYEPGCSLQPIIESHDFVRPFCTVSFLSECSIIFGFNLKIADAGEVNGSTPILLPVGSVLLFNGKGANVVKHLVPAFPSKRISITFRKMDESKRPLGFRLDPDLQNIQPYDLGSELQSENKEKESFVEIRTMVRGKKFSGKSNGAKGRRNFGKDGASVFDRITPAKKSSHSSSDADFRTNLSSIDRATNSEYEAGLQNHPDEAEEELKERYRHGRRNEEGGGHFDRYKFSNERSVRMEQKRIIITRNLDREDDSFSRKSPEVNHPVHPPQMDSSSSSVAQRYCYNPKLHWNRQVEEYFIKAYGADHFARISEALTRPSCYSCIRVNILKSTNEAVIEKLTTLLQDRTVDDLDCLNVGKQVSEGNAGYNDFRKECIDNMFNLLLEETPMNGEKPTKMSKGPSICQCQFPGLDHILFIKGSGPHSIPYGNQPDQSVKEVIVSRKCAEAVLRGAQIFVPGLLACSAHVEKGDVVAVSVAVEQPSADGGWCVSMTRGTVLQGSHADPQYLERNGMYIGQGITKFSRAGMFRALEGIAVEMTDRVYRLPSFHNLLEGEIFLQNLPSIVTAHVLDPQQGERILDMCAAPGGKTTAIAMLMRDNGEVVAVDRSHNKVLEIKKLAAEMALTCIKAYRLDALKSVRQTSEATDVEATSLDREILDIKVDKSLSKLDNGDMQCANVDRNKVDLKIMTKGNYGNGRYISNSELRKPTDMMKNGRGRNHSLGARAENSKGFPPNSFDRVLLDAPCSALGLRPRLFAAEETIESLQTHAKYQRRMFDQAVQLVRSGGVIVYSTCTINPGENEALVRYALDTYKFLSLAPQNPRIGGPGLVGKCELFSGNHTEAWLTQSEAELVQRFDPSAPLDTIGFFIAKFNVGQK